jgi:hypothetical protein
MVIDMRRIIIYAMHVNNLCATQSNKCGTEHSHNCSAMCIKAERMLFVKKVSLFRLHLHILFTTNEGENFELNIQETESKNFVLKTDAVIVNNSWQIDVSKARNRHKQLGSTSGLCYKHDQDHHIVIV